MLPSPGGRTDRVMSYVPGSLKVCVGAGSLEKCPSPKFQRKLICRSMPDNSKATSTPSQACLTEASNGNSDRIRSSVQISSSAIVSPSADSSEASTMALFTSISLGPPDNCRDANAGSCRDWGISATASSCSTVCSALASSNRLSFSSLNSSSTWANSFHTSSKDGSFLALSEC